MSPTFTDALSALAPDLFELFHGALETYLGVASGFWRQAGGLAGELSAGTAPPEARGRLGKVLADWEGVASAWRELQGAADIALAETPAELRGVLARHLAGLQREFEEQASGLQALIDLSSLLSLVDAGQAPREVPDA